MDGSPDWAQRNLESELAQCPTDRAVILAVSIKGESLTPLEMGMEEEQVDPDPDNKDNPTPLVMTQEHVQIPSDCFPFCAGNTEDLDDVIHEEAI